MIQTAPNARFWEYINGGYVKITLRPSADLSWGRWTRTEEGYASEGLTWTHKETFVLRQAEHSGQDCDGRHGQTDTAFCLLENLRSVPAYTLEYRDGIQRACPENCGPNERVCRPAWETHHPTRCYDQYAEAAGY